MRVFRVRSSLDLAALRLVIGQFDAVAIAPSAIKSLDELELAHHLAQHTFKTKTNLARKLKYEFLLWLAATSDIKQAMLATAPSDPSDFLVVILSAGSETSLLSMLSKLRAKKLPQLLPSLASKKLVLPHSLQLRLERISLSRIKN